MPKEGLLQFRADCSEMRIRGALNYEIYKTLSQDELKAFLRRDAKQLARKFVSKDWTDEVKIESEYWVIDDLYTLIETVKAKLVFTHEKGVSNDVSISIE